MNFFVKVKTNTWCSKVEVLLVTTSQNKSQREECSEKLIKKTINTREIRQMILNNTLPNYQYFLKIAKILTDCNILC